MDLSAVSPAIRAHRCALGMQTGRIWAEYWQMMVDAGKPIVISTHAQGRMTQRGATMSEVEYAIRNGAWQQAEGRRWHVRHRFVFSALSPVNQRLYTYKAVDVVFLERRNDILVVTVKVFYQN
jgi:hypothetical protein